MENPETYDAFVTATTRADPPLFDRHLKAHRSLSNQGFVITIAFTAAALALPLMAFLGTLALWTLLPYLAAALTALWYFIRRNDHDGTLQEHIRIWPDLIAVHRQNPRSADQYWMANPYWVTTRRRNTKTVENYLTLKGQGREIELGAFLTSAERITLDEEITAQLNACRQP
ncbi:DUF2244 domain-containing protein [Neptunicoccus sediminis]|uniref:DUF2244 domain-containing protein n=1 Tax=Neptunicoccus sediminis TaxID=1892596 RepID=UPI000845EAC0|nr:DUF2244 domain-containing protein [Neptunicoccus sediminis]